MTVYTGRCEGCERLRADLARVTAERDALLKDQRTFDAQEDENARLRAALEAIKNGNPGQARRIAHQVLGDAALRGEEGKS